ncbi:hypothetical protein NFI96_014719, partial [Prochilodus magdalenae]
MKVQVVKNSNSSAEGRVYWRWNWAFTRYSSQNLDNPRQIRVIRVLLLPSLFHRGLSPRTKPQEIRGSHRFISVERLKERLLLTTDSQGANTGGEWTCDPCLKDTHSSSSIHVSDFPFSLGTFGISRPKMLVCGNQSALLGRVFRFRWNWRLFCLVLSLEQNERRALLTHADGVNGVFMNV